MIGLEWLGETGRGGGVSGKEVRREVGKERVGRGGWYFPSAVMSTCTLIMKWQLRLICQKTSIKDLKCL